MKRDDYIEVAKRFLQEKHENAIVSFVAGSMTRGEFSPHSDIDIVIFYDKQNLPKAYRENFKYQGWLIETFCQHERSLDFFSDLEKKDGQCVLMNMISSGSMFPENNARGLELKQRANNYIAEGPEEYNKADSDRMRYFITDALDDLRDDRERGEYLGILSSLYNMLGQYYLKSNHQWGGKGKALYRTMKNYDDALANEYKNAFDKAFIENDMKDVICLAEKMLEGHGGLCWVGYKDYAPDKVN